MSDETRRRILERRARFVAAALGASVSASCDRVNPMVCLEPPPISADDAGTKTPASATGTTSASAPSAPPPEPDAMPLECLKIAPPPSWHPPDGGSGGGASSTKPKVCLTEMFHDDEEPQG
jgi:hypothetical protein